MRDMTLMSTEEFVELCVHGKTEALATELNRTRDVVFYLIGALEGIAMRYPEEASLARKARGFIHKEDER